MIKLNDVCSSCTRKDQLDHRCTECEAPICALCWKKTRRIDKIIRMCADCERIYDEIEIDY